MRIAICDDDQILTASLKNMVFQWSMEKNVKVDVADYATAETFLFHWSPQAEFDLILLDIMMGNMTGIELARVIRKIDQKIDIVFVTGSREHVFDGYDVHALNYLLKPVQKEALYKCLDQVREKTADLNAKSLLISNGITTRKIPYDEIDYMESFAHYIIIHTHEGDLKYKKNISDLEHALPKTHFVRTHRSYIVNIGAIASIEKSSLMLNNGASVPVSRTHWQNTNNAFIISHTR